MKQFERILIKRRNKLQRRGNALFQNAIKQQYQEFLSFIDTASLDEIETFQVSEEPIKRAFEHYYASASEIGMMYRKELLKGKAEEDIYKAVYENELRTYATTVAGKRIKKITETTIEYLISAVRTATTEAFTEGLGIELTKNLIIKNVKEQFKEITRVRARMIAQTELITASNRAAVIAAKSTGFETKKFWSTSGLAGIRPTHIQCEQESIAKGGLKENERFSNGLLFPGDPAGEASEVVNCRCSILFEIV